MEGMQGIQRRSLWNPSYAWTISSTISAPLTVVGQTPWPASVLSRPSKSEGERGPMQVTSDQSLSSRFRRPNGSP